jgi:hypothetical protein
LIYSLDKISNFIWIQMSEFERDFLKFKSPFSYQMENNFGIVESIKQDFEFFLMSSIWKWED